MALEMLWFSVVTTEMYFTGDINHKMAIKPKECIRLCQELPCHEMKLKLTLWNFSADNGIKFG